MNTGVKNVLIFVSGAAIGGIITGSFVRGAYEEIITYMKEDLADARGEAIDPKIEDEEDTIVETNQFGEQKIVPLKQNSLVTNKNKRLKKNYNTQSEVDLSTLAKKYKTADLEEKEIIPEPYVISLEEFSEEKDNFDKTTLYYYELDDTLTEQNDEIITDIYSTIGDNALSSFGEDSQDPEIVYVRNEKISTDYEVVRHDASYATVVLGYKDDDKKRVNKRSELDEE